MSEFDQAKYIQEYQKEKYDRCIFNVPKGQKKVIEAHWKKKGYESLNKYVNDLIRKDMNETAGEKQAINTENNNGIIIGRDNNGPIHFK
ncbi:hypothetical protein [Lacrimispora indolis]|uniref:hypothetical protein n=1 Tax=Lacrimispora indolis TaxID=69825 RepID=UPI0004012230|nr:hypothetical protein [[Clostridium] methoxybenzovorans]